VVILNLLIGCQSIWHEDTVGVLGERGYSWTTERVDLAGA